MNRLFTALAVALLLVCSVSAQVAVAPMPNAKPQFFNLSGSPCAGCTISTFVGGTTTPLATYTDSTGTVTNSVIITLNSAGYPPNQIWLGPFTYKFVFKDSSGVTIYTVDNITSLAGVGRTNFANIWTSLQTFNAGVFKTLNNVQMCDGYSGSTAAAKLNACLLALNAVGGGVADARGLTGGQTLDSNIFAGVTVPVRLLLGVASYSVTATQSPTIEGTTIEGQSKRAGLNSGGTILIWNGAAAGTVIDSSGTSDFTLAGLHIDGAANGGTAWKLGGTSPNYWQHGRDLFINSFHTSNQGALYFGQGANFLSDSDFYSVQISDVKIAIQGVVQDAFFYNLDIISASQQAVVLFGNSNYVQFGGHFGLNNYDIALTGSSTVVSTYGVWFENSTSGILLVSGPVTDITMNFDGDHLSTTSSTGYLIDTTNITGVVNFRGNKIFQQPGPPASVTAINLTGTLTDSERVGNSGATFVGTNITMSVPSLLIGSTANGQAVTNSSVSILGGGATGTAALNLRVPNASNNFGTSGVAASISTAVYANWQSYLGFSTNSTNGDAAPTLKAVIDPLGSFGVGTNVLASSDPFYVDQTGTVRATAFIGTGSPKIASGSASNTDVNGILTLAAGTVTYTFVNTYASAPICFSKDVTTSTNATNETVTTTTLTVTGTGTDSVKYFCVGRN